jgi:hypothetical protein
MIPFKGVHTNIKAGKKTRALVERSRRDIRAGEALQTETAGGSALRRNQSTHFPAARKN